MHALELGTATDASVQALVFEAGDTVMDTLEDHVRSHGIEAAHFTALGAFRTATLAYFDWDAQEYRDISVDGQVEVTSLVGDVAVHGDEVVIHAHCVLGHPDGSTVAGHLQDAEVRPTLELFLTAFEDRRLRREHDPESGLALIRGVEEG